MPKTLALQTKLNLIPATVFAQLPYWKALTHDEQKAVEHESQELFRARFHEGASKLEQGRHLLELKKMLEPYRVFLAHLDKFKFSRKSAYRYMDGYENVRRKFGSNPAILEGIFARGLDIMWLNEDLPFGKYTPVIKQFPPPKNADKYSANEWIDSVETNYKKHRSNLRNRFLSFPSPEPDTLMKEAFRAVRIKFRRLPNNRATRVKWLRELTGYLTTELGSEEGFSVQPLDIPETFRNGRRPQTNHKE